jgi:DNA polymerase I-like protein with 3'-5' exonuclease and polymerase domains
VGEYLHLTDLADLSQIVDSGKLEGAFELAKYRSGFARDFLTLTRAKRDEAIVRRALDSNDRLFPVFHVVGTVTGRILVSDPYLQQLRRSYRDLVLPDIGHRHIYLDYAQFEPGVLAGMTQESDFIAAYNSGDVYEHLAVALFEDTNQRERAKRAFLAFLYGMTPERIARVVVGDGGQGEGVVRNAIERFFATFPGIAAFRAAQHSLLLENGYVSSMFGNRRNRRRTGALSGKESRWAVNHPVQATASLILKEALLALATRFSPSALVLPVHDAILLELPDDDEFGARVAEATAIMIGAFRARLPEIDVRVTAKEFANG